MTSSTGARPSRIARGLLAVAVLAVLVPTLPAGRATELLGWSACLICGERGTADALVNMVLFLPLGVACALQGWSRRRSILAGAVLSAAVECVQLMTPGRDPSLGDVVFNTAGVAIGFSLARAAPLWTRLPPRHAARLSLTASICAAAVLSLAGALLRPAFPRALYYGQWTPNLGYLDWYRGRVLSATLGDLPIARRELPQSEEVRRLLLVDSGAALRVHAVAGPAAPRLASIVSITDARRREILLLGVDRGDLVLRYRTRAAAWRLDQPDIRFPGALAAVAPGDTLELTAGWRRGHYCLGVGAAGRCGLGFAAGSGWALLMYPEVFPEWLKTLLNAAWLAGLYFFTGFWARRRWETAVGTGLACAALVIVPPAAGLAAAGLSEWAGMFLGLAGGLAVHQTAAKRGAHADHGPGGGL